METSRVIFLPAAIAVRSSITLLPVGKDVVVVVVVVVVGKIKLCTFEHLNDLVAQRHSNF